MVCFSQTLQPSDLPAVQCVSAQRRANLDHALALRLYGRLRSRRILLLRPVPQGIKQQIAAWLHRDGLVPAWASYVFWNGRRLRCEAQAFTPEQWRRYGQVTWACVPVTYMRLLGTATIWPAPTGPRQMWPDLAF